MSVDLTEVARLKERADRDARKAAEADGAFKEHMRRLRDEFGVKSLEEAEKLLKSLERDVKKTESEFTSTLASFKKEYADALGTDEGDDDRGSEDY